MQKTQENKALPSESQQFLISRACEQTVLKFTAHFDAGEYSEMESLFAIDGIWKRQDGDINGLENFKAWSKNRPAGVFVRHVLSNLITKVIDAGKVVVDSYVTVYRQDFDDAPVLPAAMSLPALIGRYHDMVIKEGGNWKLAHREVKVDFKNSF